MYSILLLFIYPERGGFGEIFREVMIFPEGFSPSGGSINDILYRKSKTSVRISFYVLQVEHIFVNTMI